MVSHGIDVNFMCAYIMWCIPCCNEVLYSIVWDMVPDYVCMHVCSVFIRVRFKHRLK